MALTYRDDKGSNLTAAEVDENFRTLVTMVEEIVVPTGVGIVSFSVTGNTFTVNLSDGSVIGPYTLPTVAYRWTEEWTPGFSYQVYDFFSVPGDGVYLVLQPYDAPEDTTDGPAVFDPDVSNTSGPLLEKMFGTPSNAPVELVTETGSFTMTAEHAGRYVMVDSAGPATITVGLAEESGVVAGQITTFRQRGAGQITISAGDSSIVINTPESFVSRKQGSTVSLIYIGGDEYDLAGDLELV